MPGKSQLEKFSSDLLSLGDEVQLRAARGEQPVKIPIPKDVKDENDSEEFVVGMPEIEAEIVPIEEEDDLSDLTGLANSDGSSQGGEGEAQPVTFEAPDMSGLLDSIETPDFGDGDMPDLSQFTEQPEQEEEQVIEEEPEEVSIADMGLDALLSGAGFDAPEEQEPVEEEKKEEPSLVDDLKDYDDLEELDELDDLSPVEEELPSSNEKNSDVDLFASSLEEPFSNSKIQNTESDPFNFDNIPLDNTEENSVSPFDLNEPEVSVENEEITPSSVENIDLDNLPPLSSLDNKIDDVDDIEELEDIDSLSPLEENEGEEVAEEIPVENEFGTSVEDFNIEDTDSKSSDNVVPSSETEDFNLDDMDFGNMDFPESEESVHEEVPEDDNSDIEELPLESQIDDFSTEEMDNQDFNLDNPQESNEEIGELDELDSLDLPDMDDELSTDNDEEVTENGFGVDDFAIPEDNGFDNQEPAFSDLSSELPDFDIPDENPIDDNGNPPDGLFDAKDVEFDANEEIPELDEFSLDSLNNGEGIEESETPEIFDISEMEGLDDDILDTDAQLSAQDDDSNFDIPKDDGIGFDDSFEIPGYSDVETVKEQKTTGPILATDTKKKNKVKRGEEEDEENEDDLPPNTLSDKQYRTFKKNLSEYPLNVRIAFENLIVQNDFTEEAEFELIEKVLNKVPARQLASSLEKMLDISIPVPRDYEHRSAGEYEAYKKSISYQLKNRIIPAILLGIAGILVFIGLFNFSKNCIYKPIKANKLYSQGYVLLEESEYPLSKNKFDEATKYRLSKKWFYKYARGYREHKQYQRAGDMYQNILNCFKHEKAAGLEYADMELNDLANYERAEEIIRRELLDYHINDADGLLMLGDIFLEWGTEKDPTKFEDARQQYATLIQLNGANDLYLSRMMRYFIRTDNLREVLQLKQNFQNREKSLCGDDWTELSGYLLDKYYGDLAPSDEYLRYQIEGLRGLLIRAVKMSPENPIAHYNMGRYFIKTNEYEYIESTLQDAIEKFNAAEKMKTRDIYKYIDSYRLLGEFYITKDNFLQAQEQFAEGISLYITERDNAGFKGTPEIGKLYEDMGDIKYTVSGDYDDALLNYTQSVNLENDSPKLRYRIGYINYHNKDYEAALDSFMKAGDGYIKERNLLLAMANTLSLRGDDYAAEGYYDQLMESLDRDIASEGLLIPQAKADDYELVSTYLYGSNNYGVTLHRLAKKTGDSSKNAEAIVQLSESLKAWDALTRNPDTMVRLEGTNLAEQNIKYITHPTPEFEPEIYTNISKTLLDTEKL